LRNCSHQGDVCGFDSTSSKLLFCLTGCGSRRFVNYDFSFTLCP
jgi:hypothetical protein